MAAWWDSRRRRTSAPSCSAPSPMKRRDRSIVHGISRHEHAPLEINGLTDDVLSPIVEEDNLPVTDPALLIKVSINFTDPIIRSQYHRSYASSQGFTPSERVCKGLLRRIEHCCEELITRKDSEALTMFTNDTSTLKRQRYEMTFQITRRGSGQWAERTFRSFQKQPLTVRLTKEVVLACDRMVGLFLRHHDQGFRWLDGSVHDDYQDPQTVTPSEGGPLSLCCIPEPRFNEATQCFDMVPGYTIMLSFRSRTQRPIRTEFGKVVKVHSKQDTPLNLDLGEELLGYVSRCVQTYLKTKRREFDEEHVCCEGVSDASGSTACPHMDDDAARVDLRVLNNLGPSYDHLQREFQSQLNIFRDENLQDCLRFVRHMEHEMLDARDQIDHKITQKNDFELRLLELKSPTWSIAEPYNLRLNQWVTRPRRTIEAILDRVQTGISDVLHGNNLTVHLVAYKRGHLVMDKTLVARQARDRSQKRATITRLQKEELVARLGSRIRQDINKVCKDTCLLEEESPGDDPFLDATGLHYISDELPAEEPDVGHILGDTIQLTPKRAPLKSLRRTFSMMARPVSRRASKPEIKVDVDSERQRSGSRPTTPSTPAGSIHSSYTGTGSPRAFPLMPARYPMPSPSSHVATPAATGISHILESESILNRPGSSLDPGNVASLSGSQELRYIVLQEPATATALHQDIDRQRAFFEVSHPDISRDSQPAYMTDSVEPHPPTRAIPPGSSPLPDGLEPAVTLLRNADTATAQPSEASSEWDSSSNGTIHEDEDVGFEARGITHKDNLRKALPTNPTLEPPQPLPVQHGDHVRLRDAKAADMWLRKRPLGDDSVGNSMSSSTSEQSIGGDPWLRYSILTPPSQRQVRSYTGRTIRDYVLEGLPLQAESDDSQEHLLLHQETIHNTNSSQPYYSIGNPGLDDERTSSFENRNIALEGGQDTGPDTNQAHVEKQHTLLVAAEWVDGLENTDEEPKQEGLSATLKDTIEGLTTPNHKIERVMVDMLPISALAVAEISSEEQASKVNELAIRHDKYTVVPRASDGRGPFLSEHAVKEGEYAFPTETINSCPLLCHEPVVTDLPSPHPQLPEKLGGEDGLAIFEDSIFATENSISTLIDAACVHEEAIIADHDAEVEKSVTLVNKSSAASSTETDLGPVESPVSPPHSISIRTTEDGALVVEEMQPGNQDGLTSLIRASDIVRGIGNASAGKEDLIEGEQGTVAEHPHQTSSEELVLMLEAQVAAPTDLPSSPILPVSEDDLVPKPLSLMEGLSKQVVEPAEEASAAMDHDPDVTELTTSTRICAAEGCLEFSVAEGRDVPFFQKAKTMEKLAKARGKSPVLLLENLALVAKVEGSPAAVEAVKYEPAIAKGFKEASAAAGGAPASHKLIIVPVTEAKPETTPKEDEEPVVTDERITEESVATAEPAAEKGCVPANSMEVTDPEESLAAAVDENDVSEATTAVGETAPAPAETAAPSDDAVILEDVAALREITPAEQLSSVDRVEEEPAKEDSPDMTEIAKVKDDKTVEPESSRKENPVEDGVTRDETLPVEERHAAPRAAAKGTSPEPTNTVEVTLSFEDEDQCSVLDAGVAEEQTVPQVQDIVLESLKTRLETENVELEIEKDADEAPSVVEEEVKTAPEHAATNDEAAEDVSADNKLVDQAAESQPPEDELASAGLHIIEPVLAEEEISPSERSGAGPEVVTEPSLEEPAAEGVGPAIAEDSSPDEEVTTPTSPEQVPFLEMNKDATGCLTQVQNLSVDQPQHSPECQADGMGWGSSTSALEESVQPLGNSRIQDTIPAEEIGNSRNRVLRCPARTNLPLSFACLEKESASSLEAAGPAKNSLSPSSKTAARIRDVVKQDFDFEPRLSSEIQASDIQWCPEACGGSDSLANQTTEIIQQASDAEAQDSVINGVLPIPRSLVNEKRSSSGTALRNEGLQATLVKGHGGCPHDPASVQHHSSCALPRTEGDPFPDRSSATTKLEGLPDYEVSIPLTFDVFASSDTDAGEDGQTFDSSKPRADLDFVPTDRGDDSSTESQVPVTSSPSSKPPEPEAAIQEGAEGAFSAEPGERPLNVDRRMDANNQDEQEDATVQVREVQHDKGGEVEKTSKNEPTTEAVAEPAQDVTPKPVLTVKADARKDEPLAEPYLMAADEPIATTAVESLAETAPVIVHESCLGSAPVSVTGSAEETAPAAEESAPITEPVPELPVTIPKLECGWAVETVGKFPREEAPQNIVEELLQEEATPETALVADQGVPKGEPGPERADDAAVESCAGEARVELPVVRGEASEDELETAVKSARKEVVLRNETSKEYASELPILQDVTEHVVEAAVAPRHAEGGVKCEIADHAGTDQVDAAMIAALPAPFPKVNGTRAVHTGKTWCSEAVELPNSLEILPPEDAEGYLDLRTPRPILSCRQCSTETRTEEDGFQNELEIPSTDPESSASEGADKFGDQTSSPAAASCCQSPQVGKKLYHPGTAIDVSENAHDGSGGGIVQPMVVSLDTEAPNMPIDFCRSPSIQNREENIGYSSESGRTQECAVPELALTDTVGVTQPAAPAVPGSCEPQAVTSLLDKDVLTAILMGHTASSPFEQEDDVPHYLGGNELYHLMDAQCIDLVPTKWLELPNCGVEESLVDAKANAMNADEPSSPTHLNSEQLGETETTHLKRSGLALLTENLDQQTLTPETAQSGATLQEASSPFDDSHPKFDPMATIKARQLQKLYASEEANESWARSAPARTDTAIFAPSNRFTAASPFPSHSHASVESTSSHASSFVSERDSVDTYAPSLEGDLAEPAAEPEREYCPQTAGWLGLHRPVQRPRRFSMPLQYLREHSMVFDTSNRPGTADSTLTVKPSPRKGGQETPVPVSSGAAIVPSETAQRTYEKRSVVPRMVMLLAGVAIAGKMLNASRH